MCTKQITLLVSMAIVGLCQPRYIECCTPLSEEHVHAKYLDNVSNKYGNDLSFLYVIEPLLEIARIKGEVAKRSNCEENAMCSNPVSIDNVDVGQNSCPRRPIRRPGALQQHTSICPWFYITVSNSSRYPDQLTEARCCQSHCLADGPPTCNCELITRVVPMVTRTELADSRGHCLYKTEFYEMPVACIPSVQYAPQ